MEDLTYLEGKLSDLKHQIAEEREASEYRAYAKKVSRLFAALKEEGLDEEKAWDVTWLILKNACDQ